MPRYSEPGLILSSLDDHDVPLEMHPSGFNRNDAFMFRESITFDRYICYAGSVGVLDEYTITAEAERPEWTVKLSFILGTHHGHRVTGFLQGQLDRMSQHIRPLYGFCPSLQIDIPKRGDMVQLQHQLPLLDEHLTVLKPGSAIFLAEVGGYSGPMEFVDIKILQDGRRHSLVIQAFATATHMRVVSSINDACDDGRK